MESTPAELVEAEKQILADYAGYDFAAIFHAIRPTGFFYSEAGGYADVAKKLLHPVAAYSKYNYKIDKPYYDFDFRAREFHIERVLWHLHPFQGEEVHNSYPSFQDLNTALERPDKVFVLVAKLGSYVYRSTVNEARRLNGDYYQNALMPFFRPFRALAAINEKRAQEYATAATLQIDFVAPHEDLWQRIRGMQRRR